MSEYFDKWCIHSTYIYMYLLDDCNRPKVGSDGKAHLYIILYSDPIFYARICSTRILCYGYIIIVHDHHDNSHPAALDRAQGRVTLKAGCAGLEDPINFPFATDSSILNSTISVQCTLVFSAAHHRRASITHQSLLHSRLSRRPVLAPIALSI